jgi:proteasome assembly chaperone (PAC2) family protein
MKSPTWSWLVPHALETKFRVYAIAEEYMSVIILIGSIQTEQRRRQYPTSFHRLMILAYVTGTFPITFQGVSTPKLSLEKRQNTRLSGAATNPNFHQNHQILCIM